MNKYLFLGLLLLTFGCSSKQKEDSVSAIEYNSPPMPLSLSAHPNNATPCLLHELLNSSEYFLNNYAFV